MSYHTIPCLIISYLVLSWCACLVMSWTAVACCTLRAMVSWKVDLGWFLNYFGLWNAEHMSIGVMVLSTGTPTILWLAIRLLLTYTRRTLSSSLHPGGYYWHCCWCEWCHISTMSMHETVQLLQLELSCLLSHISLRGFTRFYVFWLAAATYSWAHSWDNRGPHGRTCSLDSHQGFVSPHRRVKAGHPRLHRWNVQHIPCT